MLLCLRAAGLALMTLVLAWHGAGVPAAEPDECACEDAERSVARSAGDAGATGAQETCPPDCDDCVCCGTLLMLATSPSIAVRVAPVHAVTSPAPAERDTPRGEPSGVFRPPRA